MKNYFLIVLFLLTIHTFSQDLQTDDSVETVELSLEDKKEIETTLATYFKLIYAKEWSKSLDMMPDVYFELAPKDMILEQIVKAYSNEAFTTTFDQLEFKEIQSSINFKGVVYSKVSYLSSMSFHFIDDDFEKPEEFETYVALMEGLYVNQFKGQKVTRDKNVINIKGNKLMILINYPNQKDLKLIEYDTSMEAFYEILFPKKVAKSLKAKNQ